jgi:hypothetical protein
MPTKLTYHPYVRHSVTVDASPDKAFDAFLADLPAWWHPSYRTTKLGAPFGVDAREGGRWFEIDEAGIEHSR